MKLSRVSRSTATALGATMIMGLVMPLAKSAQANNRFVEGIIQQLAGAAILAGYNGGHMTHEPKIDALNNHGKHMISLNLRSGISYGLVGVCDSDCADIDLRLYDENYELIDTDTRSNDIPVVTVMPNWTGRFYLEVDMESCRANYCYYGVGVFGQ